MRNLKLFFVIVQFIMLAGCQRYYQPQNLRYGGYSVIAGDSTSQGIQQLVRPYADSVASVMSDPIGTVNINLEKKLPEGTLGNFLADAYLEMARIKWDKNAAVAYMNHGGIRSNAISSGVIKRSTVFEVMPFDNEMILLEVPGTVLKKFLDVVAGDGGGGVAGMSFTIKDKKAENILIGGQPLDPARKYLMVNSDYVVNGGGGFNGLKDLSRTRTGYLLRDAILDYVAMFTKKNLPVQINTDKRISSEK